MFLWAGLLILGMAGTTLALRLYVDAAPNKNGSSDYSVWEAAAFVAAANGTFINMANSVNPTNVGTTDGEIEDEAVHSFDDFRKRVTWIYWRPEENVADLDARDAFKMSLFNTRDGDVLGFNDDYYGSTWLTLYFRTFFKMPNE